MRLYILLLLCILTSVHSGAQPYEPNWGQPLVSYTTVKMKIRNEAQKVIFDDYKQAKISLSGEDGRMLFGSIDIPDKYYIKDGEITGFEFKKDLNGISIAYTISSGNKVAVLYFGFSESSFGKTPDYIVLSAVDNIHDKKAKSIILTLYEFKAE